MQVNQKVSIDNNLFNEPSTKKRRVLNKPAHELPKNAGNLLVQPSCGDELSDTSDLIASGKKFTPIVHRAIYVYFEGKERLTNPKFNPKNFRKNNSDFAHNTTKKWKHLPGVINLLESAKQRYGEEPFERHTEIPWITNGSLISLHELPRHILTEYCDDPTSLRFVHPDGRIKYSTKKYRKFGFNNLVKIISIH